MSCAESYSTDSGVRKPVTVATLVAPGGAGTAAETVVVSAVERFLSTGMHAASASTSSAYDGSFIAPLRLVLGFRQLFLARFHDFLCHVGRHLLVRVEFLTVRAAPVRQRV